jgi:hypothetical protein
MPKILRGEGIKEAGKLMEYEVRQVLILETVGLDVKFEKFNDKPIARYLSSTTSNHPYALHPKGLRRT